MSDPRVPVTEHRLLEDQTPRVLVSLDSDELAALVESLYVTSNNLATPTALGAKLMKAKDLLDYTTKMKKLRG